MSSPASSPHAIGETSEAAPDRSLMSERLRAARVSTGKSARRLAAELGCSPSLISQIERGKAVPSVGRLFAMTTALGISMDSLFPETQPDLRAKPEREQPDSLILHRQDRPAIDLEHGIRWERLTRHPEQGVEFREVFYEVGGGSPDSERAIQHNGRDYAVIIEGELTARIGFEKFLLRQGDSLAFDATIPHQFWNQGSRRVRAVFVMTDRRS
jgi:transcriptional regulator with XRE-family HTH domain